MKDPLEKPVEELLQERRGEIYLKVHAHPGSSREGIRGLHGSAIRVAVRASPERGKANAAILEVLARALGLRRSQIALESGETSREKRIRIEGATLATLETRLRSILGSE